MRLKTIGVVTDSSIFLLQSKRHLISGLRSLYSRHHFFVSSFLPENGAVYLLEYPDMEEGALIFSLGALPVGWSPSAWMGVGREHGVLLTTNKSHNIRVINLEGCD